MHTVNRILVTIAAGLALTIGAGPAAAKGGSHGVKGHVTKKGTYVAPTRATNPNKTKKDNYSSKGNTNPANGKQGTKNPENNQP